MYNWYIYIHTHYCLGDVWVIFRWCLGILNFPAFWGFVFCLQGTERLLQQCTSRTKPLFPMWSQPRPGWKGCGSLGLMDCRHHGIYIHIYTRRICHWRSWKYNISNGSKGWKISPKKPGLLDHPSHRHFSQTSVDSVDFCTSLSTTPAGHHGLRSSIGLVSYVHSTPWFLWTSHLWASWNAARHFPRSQGLVDGVTPPKVGRWWAKAWRYGDTSARNSFVKTLK